MMLSMTSGNKLEEQQQKSSSSEVEVSSGGETTTTTTGSSMLHTAAASPSPSPSSSSSSSSSSSTSSVSDETTTTTIKVDEAAKEEAAEPIINSGTPSSPQAQTQCDDEDETGAMIIEQQTSTDNNNNNTISNTSNTQTTESIIPSSPSSSCPDTLLAAKLLSIYDYWKNFDIKKLQDDLNDQIDSMHKTQEEFNELSNKFSELSRELKKLVSEEDELKTVSSLLKLFQNEIEGLSRRCKSTESTCIDLFKLLTNVPDPFPVIESIKTNKCELQLSKRILKLQNENKTLREKLSELSPNKSKMAAEKEIILRLTDNVTKTSSLNLELSSKLKISEGEIESYKKLLSDYQKELFEMKNKHINEIKSEILKENDKQQRKQLESSTSTLQSQNSNTSENNNNSSNNNNTNNKNDKLTSYEMLKKSMSNDALKSAPTNNGTTNNKINNENNSNNPLKLLLDTKCISGSPPPSSSSSSSSYSSTSSSSSSTSSSSVSPSSSTAITPNKQAASVAAAQPLTTSTPSHSDHFSGLKSNYFRSSNPNQSSSSSSSALMSESASTLSDSAANIDLTNNGEFLNTSDIAGRVRDLLSVHNIGQRVFAKYILGLSQGTVSELLSKPKHWSKLTEKGRESYRKMHAWASSDESIGTLKALGPRKGNKDTYFYQNGGAASAANPLSIAPKDSEAASSSSSITTDQKIAAILDEAKRQMMAQGKLDPSSYSAASSPSRSSSRHSSQSAIDDSPYMKREYETNNEEMVANNNEEEDEDHDETEDQQDSEDMPAFRSSQYSYPLDLTTKPKQVLLSMGGENSNPKKRKLDYSMSDNENDTATPISSAQNAVAAALWRQQQFNRPVLSSIDQLKLLSGGQTSSSFSTPTTSSLSNSSTTKPLKCILPPVSQEQFDKYSNINTDELVKRVKDLLSKYSISQRLFGECILGLSQGSVSDLLARPKHWVMLTQKGREPFIRMQMFIDDPDSIKRLMANQYKGPAATTIAAASLSTSPVPTAAAALNILNDCNLNGGAVAAKSLVQSRASSLSSMLNAAALAASPSGLLQIDATKESNNNHKNHNHHHHHHQHSKSFTNNTTSNSHHHHNHHHHNSSFSQENPTEDHISSSPLIKSSSSVNNTPSTPTPTSTSTPAAANIIPYDISQLSALSSDFNTEEITNRVKETLLNNNIGQKLFGEAVLNLSQGTVSELLSKPKPWQTLSIKGREPYLRMYMWLTDAHKLEKLSEWKEERSALKQRAAAASTAAAVASAAAANAAIDHMSGGSSADGEQKPKRRFIFSEEQKEQLMKAFKYDPYPAVTQMEQLAARLGLQTRTVINWFHNHRMRIRYKSNSAGLNNLSNGAANSPSELNPFIHGPQLTSSGGGGRISRANQASRSSQFTSASSQQNPFSSALSGIGETNSSMYNEDETLVSASNYEDDTDMNQSSSSPMNNHHNQASYNDDDMTGGGEEETANYEDDEEAGGTSDNEDESGAEINSLYLNNEANEDEEDEENTDALGNTDLNNNNVNDDDDEDDDEDKYSDNSGHNNTAAHLNSFLQHHSLQSQSHSAKRRKPHNPQKLNYGAAMAAAAMVQAIAAAAASLKQQQQQQHHDD